LFFGFVSKNVTNTTTREGGRITIAWANELLKSSKYKKKVNYVWKFNGSSNFTTTNGKHC
jgi:hypothetical protein